MTLQLLVLTMNDPVAVDDTDTVKRDASITRVMLDTTFDVNADDTDADGETLNNF